MARKKTTYTLRKGVEAGTHKVKGVIDWKGKSVPPDVKRFKVIRLENPEELGKGTVVRAKKTLGGVLKDIPEGSEGKVIDYFGGPNRPIVKFKGTPEGREIVVDNPEADLEILKYKAPEEPRVATKYGEYYDDGSGYIFHYDVEIPEWGDAKINGKTGREWDQEADKLWAEVRAKYSDKHAEALEKSLGEEEVSEEEQELVDEVSDYGNDITLYHKYSEVAEFWEDQSFDELGEQGFEVE